MEMSLDVKLKTSLGSKGFYFQTEHIKTTEKIKETEVKMKKEIENKLAKTKRKIENEGLSADTSDDEPGRAVWSIRTPTAKKTNPSQLTTTTRSPSGTPAATSTPQASAPMTSTPLNNSSLSRAHKMVTESPKNIEEMAVSIVPPAVTITPVNKKRAPHNRKSGNISDARKEEKLLLGKIRAVHRKAKILKKDSQIFLQQRESLQMSGAEEEGGEETREEREEVVLLL